jgi:hypothetical protein
LLEKSIGPLTETMPNHGRSFSMDLLNYLSQVKVTVQLVFKEESICLLSCHPGMYCLCKKIQISKANVYMWHGGTPLRDLVKIVCIQ